MRYSLRTLVIVITVAALLCNGALHSGVARLERVAIQGRGVRVHLGSWSGGWVDYRGDDRGVLVGVWRFASFDDGGIGYRQEVVPIFEIQLSTAPT